MANWRPESSRKIKDRYVIVGKMVLDTPAAFSTGETTGTEAVILQDALEHRPLIPGASMAGALRQYLLARQFGYRARDKSGKADSSLAIQLFGEALNEDTYLQSRVIVYDALGKGRLTNREGVKIAGETRTADEGMLFSSQVWEAGTTFDLRFELVIYDGDDEANLLQALAGTLLALEKGEIALGGRKHRGYGRVHVENWQVCKYLLASPTDLAAWLNDEIVNNAATDFFSRGAHLVDNRQYVRVEAVMQLCDSMLIRQTSSIADQEYLKSNGRPVLSGTSLAGAMRARALKIANTLKPHSAVELVDDLFGMHGADGDSDSLSASRVRIEEHPIEGGQTQLIQNRVKIDRFTGGAFESALFSEIPVFARDGSTWVHVNFELRYPADTDQHRRLDAQAGLLLLTLKDMWTEDLPVGGEASIGRGRLKGISGTVHIHSASGGFKVHLDEKGLTEKEQVAKLNGYVATLWNVMGVTP